MWFEALFELEINLEKSEIILVGGVESIAKLARRVWIQGWCSPLFLYRSFYLGALFKSTLVWDGVEGLHRRLALWKRQYIIKEGV